MSENTPTNTHKPVYDRKKDPRPHVPIMDCTIGEYFRRIQDGYTPNKPDADFNSLVRSEEKRRRRKAEPAPEPKAA